MSDAERSPPTTLELSKLTREEDSNVAVFGIGCVGLSILQGCRAKKCKRVFAIDTNDRKKEWAMKFGATDFVNPGSLSKDTSIVDHLVKETDGGLDFTFDATGNVCLPCVCGDR